MRTRQSGGASFTRTAATSESGQQGARVALHSCNVGMVVQCCDHGRQHAPHTHDGHCAFLCPYRVYTCTCHTVTCSWHAHPTPSVPVAWEAYVPDHDEQGRRTRTTGRDD